MAERKQIHIEVRDKVATLKSMNFQLVGGNSDYEVVFDFDRDWADHEAKTAIYLFGDEPIYKPFIGNFCEGVAVENSSVCYIGVFSGDIITTTYAEVGVRASIRDIAKGKPKEPSKDVYNEIIDLINKTIVGSNLPYDDMPEMDGVADNGESPRYARGDHRHPTDTSRASQEYADEIAQRLEQVEGGNAERDAALEEIKVLVENQNDSIDNAVKTSGVAFKVAREVADTANNALATANNAFDLVEENNKLVGTFADKIKDVTNVMNFVGVSNTDPIKSGASVDDVEEFQTGDVVVYGNQEYVYIDGEWREYGDITAASAALTQFRAEVNAELERLGDNFRTVSQETQELYENDDKLQQQIENGTFADNVMVSLEQVGGDLHPLSEVVNYCDRVCGEYEATVPELETAVRDAEQNVSDLQDAVEKQSEDIAHIKDNIGVTLYEHAVTMEDQYVESVSLYFVILSGQDKLVEDFEREFEFGVDEYVGDVPDDVFDFIPSDREIPAVGDFNGNPIVSIQRYGNGKDAYIQVTTITDGYINSDNRFVREQIWYLSSRARPIVLGSLPNLDKEVF